MEATRLDAEGEWQEKVRWVFVFVPVINNFPPPHRGQQQNLFHRKALATALEEWMTWYRENKTDWGNRNRKPGSVTRT